MHPNKHRHCEFIILFGIFFVMLIGMAFEQAREEIFGFFSLLLFLLGCFSPIFVKAKCEKCGFDMDQHCRTTRSYECAKCGWTYDTGSPCD